MTGSLLCVSEAGLRADLDRSFGTGFVQLESRYMYVKDATTMIDTKDEV